METMNKIWRPPAEAAALKYIYINIYIYIYICIYKYNIYARANASQGSPDHVLIKKLLASEFLELKYSKKLGTEKHLQLRDTSLAFAIKVSAKTVQEILI